MSAMREELHHLVDQLPRLSRIPLSGRRRSLAPSLTADMLLCGTGVLLAAGNIKDRAHQACVGLLRQAEGPLLVPSPILGEIGYLLQSRMGPQAEAAR